MDDKVCREQHVKEYFEEKQQNDPTKFEDNAAHSLGSKGLLFFGNTWTKAFDI